MRKQARALPGQLHQAEGCQELRTGGLSERSVDREVKAWPGQCHFRVLEATCPPLFRAKPGLVLMGLQPPTPAQTRGDQRGEEHVGCRPGLGLPECPPPHPTSPRRSGTALSGPVSSTLFHFHPQLCSAGRWGNPAVRPGLEPRDWALHRNSRPCRVWPSLAE